MWGKYFMYMKATFFSAAVLTLIFLFTNAAPPAATLTVTQQVEGLLGKRIFGTNLLYWVENDFNLQKPQLKAALETIRVKMLRFPGGEVADNYNWETNQLDDPDYFPKSLSPNSDPITRTSYTEFMPFAKSLDADVNFVVNVEGGFKANDLASYVQRAKRWVIDANVTRRYGVKYWEIGNESYHCGGRYALTATEYANALVRFSSAMKTAGSPVSLMIGAVGPFSPTDAGCMDEVTPQGRAWYRSMSLQERLSVDAKSRRDFIAYLNRGAPSPASQPWWKIVTTIAGAHFDWIVLHRYDVTRTHAGSLDYSGPLRIRETIGAIRSVIHNLKAEPFETGVTEWNVGQASANGLTEHQKATVLAEHFIQYMKAGVNLANFWPLEFHGDNFPELIDIADKSVNSTGTMFMSFSTNVQQRRMAHSVLNGGGLETLVTSSFDGKKTAIFVVNTLNEARQFNIAGIAGVLLNAQTLIANPVGESTWRRLSPLQTKAGIYSTLAPMSYTYYVLDSTPFSYDDPHQPLNITEINSCMLPNPASPLYYQVQANLSYAKMYGQSQTMDFYIPRGITEPKPLVILVHGDDWKAGDKSSLKLTALRFVMMGYAVANLNFPTEASGGYQFPAGISGLRCALRFLTSESESLGIDPNRFAILGRSSGANLGGLLAFSNRASGTQLDSSDCEYNSTRLPTPKAFVGFSGPYDLTVPSMSGLWFLKDYIGSMSLSVAQRASPAYWLHAGSPPALLIHGDADSTMPFVQSQIMLDQLRANQIQSHLLKLSGAPHAFEPFSSEYLRATCTMMGFINEKLKE